MKHKRTWLAALAGIAIVTISLGTTMQPSAQETRSVVTHDGDKTYVWHLTSGAKPEVVSVTRYSINNVRGHLERKEFPVKQDSEDN